ncbi:hypothetical protein CLAFUR0_02688, partial [Fulvia fulva]
MKYINAILPVALSFIVGASAQETSSTLMIPGPMEQSFTAISGTRTGGTMTTTSMPSMTESSTSTSASSGSQASVASSVVVNAGNPGGDSPPSTGPSAGDPGNVSQTGVSAAQNTGNPIVGAVRRQQALLLGLGVG